MIDPRSFFIGFAVGDLAMLFVALWVFGTYKEKQRERWKRV